MNLAEISINRKTTNLVLTVVALVAGVIAFQSLGRLEDPEFTIKQAVVITQYPGASPREVEEEVTEKIEQAIQAMGQLREVTSISRPGLSIVYPEMQDRYDKHTLPQVWDELRRKVGDVQAQLPPGVLTPVVNDDFGDVYGVYLALSGDGYSYAELWDVAKFLKRELLLVTDVAKVAFWGSRSEVIYVEMSRARLSQLGISPQEVFQTLGLQNQIANSGRVRVGEEYIRVEPSGMFTSVEELSNLLVRGQGSTGLVYLKDVANIRRGYQDPPRQIMTLDGENAIGIGISTRLGGNAVNMGEGVQKRLDELGSRIPAGMELGVVSFQSEDVTKAIDGFVINLLEALAIVVGVLMIFMGWRSAVLIGLSLLITIIATFVLMGMYSVNLERISLGALIIALGMLVDNAIVVTEGILVGTQKGQSRAQAAIDTVGKQSMPLLGATVVAIMAFAVIGVSQDSSGEFCRSLFQVILFSLGLSWLVAVTVVPLLGTFLLKPGESSEADDDPYAGKGLSRLPEGPGRLRGPSLDHRGRRGWTLRGCPLGLWLRGTELLSQFHAGPVLYGLLEARRHPHRRHWRGYQGDRRVGPLSGGSHLHRNLHRPGPVAIPAYLHTRRRQQRLWSDHDLGGRFREDRWPADPD